MSSCGWQGFGFGASYEDAGCVDGKASDLDNCETSGEEVLIAVGDEECPQCAGIGKELGFKSVGVMAFYRQKERNSLLDLMELLPDEMIEDAKEEVNGVFRLLLKLEGAQQ